MFFEGKREYLFHLFTHIDAPLLKVVNIEFDDWVAFDILQIWPFIDRTETFKAFNQAHMQFTYDFWCLIHITLSSRSGATGGRTLVLSFLHADSDWSLQCLTHCQAHHLFSPPLVDLKPVGIEMRDPPYWICYTEVPVGNTKWLALLCPFSTVRKLYISKEVAVYVAPALEELKGERGMEILPVLQNLFIQRLHPSGPVREAIGWLASCRVMVGGYVGRMTCDILHFDITKVKLVPVLAHKFNHATHATGFDVG